MFIVLTCKSLLTSSVALPLQLQGLQAKLASRDAQSSGFNIPYKVKIQVMRITKRGFEVS